jgi:hypothetical protein
MIKIRFMGQDNHGAMTLSSAHRLHLSNPTPTTGYTATTGIPGVTAQPPVFIIHDLPQALAALAASDATGIAIQIESAPGAAGYAGASWFAAVIEAARAAHPHARALAVLDCGAEPGLALGAMRTGVDAIRTRARPAARAKIKAIGQAAKVKVLEGKPGRALDLGAIQTGTTEIEDAARDYLAKHRPH